MRRWHQYSPCHAGRDGRVEALQMLCRQRSMQGVGRVPWEEPRRAAASWKHRHPTPDASCGPPGSGPAGTHTSLHVTRASTWVALPRHMTNYITIDVTALLNGSCEQWSPSFTMPTERSVPLASTAGMGFSVSQPDHGSDVSLGKGNLSPSFSRTISATRSCCRTRSERTTQLLQDSVKVLTTSCAVADLF